MKRTDARELAFKTIYSKFFNPTEYDANIFSKANNEDLDFATKIIQNFAVHYNDINNLLTTHLKGYTVDRLFKIDLAILAVAIIELNYIKENPKEVVINEAVELAKKFSTEKSPKFINGVLAEIFK